MSEKRIKAAGWVCIISAVTALPIGIMAIILALITEFEEDVPAIRAAEVGLSFISLCLFVYIFHSLRRLLAEQLDFRICIG